MKAKCSSRGLTDSLDLFSRPIYSFTFKKSPVMSTWPGVCCTGILLLFVILFTLSKINDYASGVYNVVSFSQYTDAGFYDSSDSLDKVVVAFGLQYKEEYQSEMATLKEEDLKKVVSMKMNIIEKSSGEVKDTKVRL